MLKYLSLLILVLADIPTPDTIYFTQQVDHFNSADTRVFQQKVLVYDKYYKKGGPIFLYAGNEGPIEWFYNNTGLVFDWAPEFNALILFPEHRYYGDSLPFGPIDSFLNSNLGWLRLEQAIADYAIIVDWIKEIRQAQDAPVIAFGGSYGGVLAAALRIHYPASIDMALAASAPIPQTLNTVDPTLFFYSITQVFAIHDARCPGLVKNGFAEIENQLLSTLSSIFNVCGGLNSTADVAHLKMWATNAFTLMAMGNYPYPSTFLGNLPAWPMNYSCEVMLSNSNSPLDGLAAIGNLVYSQSSSCNDIYTQYVSCADQTGCGTGPAAKAWDYQECTQIIYQMKMNGVTDMFPPRAWTMANLTSYCKENYNVAPGDAWMRLWFPLDLANITSRIIFSNGMLDPWHLGGYLEDLSDDLPAITIKDGAHHLDLRGSNPADPESVIVARGKEKNFIKKWLRELQV